MLRMEVFPVPNVGEKKPCDVEGCDGELTWRWIKGEGSAFAHDGTKDTPEPWPDYLAWVCSSGFHEFPDENG